MNEGILYFTERDANDNAAPPPGWNLLLKGSYEPMAEVTPVMAESGTFRGRDGVYFTYRLRGSLAGSVYYRVDSDGIRVAADRNANLVTWRDAPYAHARSVEGSVGRITLLEEGMTEETLLFLAQGAAAVIHGHKRDCNLAALPKMHSRFRTLAAQVGNFIKKLPATRPSAKKIDPLHEDSTLG